MRALSLEFGSFSKQSSARIVGYDIFVISHIYICETYFQIEDSKNRQEVYR